ncbi:hypothetical protein JCM11251_000845 [Rhodosporidiobolus azoricus]
MCIPIPIIFGLGARRKPEPGQHHPQQCPNCHNMTVAPFSERKVFELFWVPLIPLKKKHLLMIRSQSPCTPGWTVINPAGDPSKNEGAASQQFQQQQNQPDGNVVPPGGRGYDVGYHQQQGAKV